MVKAQQSAAIKEFEAYQKTNKSIENTDDKTGLSRLAKYEPQMESAIGALESAKAGLNIAKLELKRTEVYAPASGYLISVAVNEGQIIVANNAVIELLQTGMHVPIFLGLSRPA